MTALIAAIIFAVVGITFFGLRKHAAQQAGQNLFLVLGIFATLLTVTCLIGSCVRVVPTGHTGVVTTFGKVEDVTYEAGINFVAPWKKVTNMDNRTQKASLAVACFSSDIQEVTLTYTVNYQIDKKNAQTIYKTIGVDYFDKVVEPKILEAVKGVFARYNAESLIASRGMLSTEVESILQESLEPYNVQLVSTAIEDIDFADGFTDAVEQKQIAEQNKLRAQTEQEQAIIEANAKAEMKVIEANAESESLIIAAQADAEVAKIGADAAEYQGQKDAAIMSNIGEMLQKYPELNQYYYVTTWNGEMPDTMLGDSTSTLFNLGE